MPPAKDICHTCQVNAIHILQAANTSENEKRDNLLMPEKHLQFAKQQRDYYRRKVSKTSIVTTTTLISLAMYVQFRSCTTSAIS